MNGDEKHWSICQSCAILTFLQLRVCRNCCCCGWTSLHFRHEVCHGKELTGGSWWCSRFWISLCFTATVCSAVVLTGYSIKLWHPLPHLCPSAKHSQILSCFETIIFHFLFDVLHTYMGTVHTVIHVTMTFPIARNHGRFSLQQMATNVLQCERCDLGLTVLQPCPK